MITSLILLAFFTGLYETSNVTEQSPPICLFGMDVLRNGTVYSNGSLGTPDGHEYPKSTWQRKRDGTFQVCKCTVRPCFRKCCPEGQAFLTSNFSVCVNSTEHHREIIKKRPTIYNEDDLTPYIHGDNVSSFHDHFDILYGFCSDKRFHPDPDEMDEFHLLKNGKVRGWGGSAIYDLSRYCYDVFLDSEEIIPFMCEEAKQPGVVQKIVYNAGMLISTPFLAATFIIYAIVPKLHTLHGRSLMSHVLALFVGFLFIPLTSFLHPHLSIEVRMMFAFIIYFAFLASFFWLNVMCLDIWWTFSGFRPMRGSVKEREHKKFIIYSLYCWGSPLIMLIICMIMDLHPGIPDNYEKPGFGELKCWFRSNMANFIYFSGPIAILIVCNIILFILTAVKIRQVKRGTKILKKQDSRRHNEEEENNAQRFNLYLKLFLVMGVNWIMEIVSFAAGGPDEYWYITDIANTLQGVLIFIIFVWKDRIRKLLVERFCPSRAVNSNSLANSSSTRTTAIRHNGSVMSSGRPSFRNNKDDYQMKTLTTVRSDDSDIA